MTQYPFFHLFSIGILKTWFPVGISEKSVVEYTGMKQNIFSRSLKQVKHPNVWNLRKSSRCFTIYLDKSTRINISFFWKFSLISTSAQHGHMWHHTYGFFYLFVEPKPMYCQAQFQFQLSPIWTEFCIISDNYHPPPPHPQDSSEQTT